MANNLEKVHKALWRTQERLAKDKAELVKLEALRAGQVADEALSGEETIDTGLPRKIEALKIRIKEQDNVMSEIIRRHREALQEQLEEEGGRRQKEREAWQGRRAAAQLLYGKSLAATLSFQAELEALNAAVPMDMTPPAGPSFIEGTTEEVLETAKTSANIALDPRSLSAALADLRARPLAGYAPFRGNAIFRDQKGTTYVPAIGKVHIDFDPDGKVTRSDIISVLAIEATQQNGVLVPAPGAVPVKLEEELQGGKVLSGKGFNLTQASTS